MIFQCKMMLPFFLPFGNACFPWTGALLYEEEKKHIKTCQSKLFCQTKFSDLHFFAEELDENAIKNMQNIKEIVKLWQKKVHDLKALKHICEKPFDCKECKAKKIQNIRLKCHRQKTYWRKTIDLIGMWNWIFKKW